MNKNSIDVAKNASSETLTVVGIDLAKNVLPSMASTPPARPLVKLGHTPKLMAPKFVAPYRIQGKHGKNDANDAAAICEAVTRPKMRFVPLKSEDAQSPLTVHRVRQGFVEERTATINRIRGLMSELGATTSQLNNTVCSIAGLPYHRTTTLQTNYKNKPDKFT